MKRFIGAIIRSSTVIPVMICIGVTMSSLFDEGYLFPEIERYSDKWDTVNMAISMTPAVILGCAYWLAIWVALVRWTKVRLVGTLLLILVAMAGALGIILPNIKYTDISGEIFLANALFAAIFILGSIPIWKRTQDDYLAHLDDHSSYPNLEAIIYCPACQNDMTNLAELICPGCNKHYTIDELLSANAPEPAEAKIPNTEAQTDSQEAGQ